MNKAITILLPVFLIEVIANSAWVCISYDWRFRSNTALACSLSVAAGAISGAAWFYMSRGISQNQMFFYNLVWDFIVSSIFIALPILFYGIKLDNQTAIGTALAFVGLLIMHHE